MAIGLGIFTLFPAHGQESFGGTPAGLRPAMELPDPPVVSFPAVDATALMAEDEARLAQGIKGPYRFGFDHPADLSLANSGIWQELPNGDGVWRIILECPEAHSVNFEFHDYLLPEGAEVYVYNEFEILGAFTAATPGGQTSMGVSPLAGDHVTIEYVEPAAVRGQGSLRIGQVTHAYRDVFGLAKGLGDSGACNNNVKCPEGDPWRDQIRSVAIIIAGGGLCTGQLINNCAEDATPYFLTARHCLPGNLNVSNWLYRFNWESPVCLQNQNGPTNQSVSGSQLLAQVASADAALIEFNNPVPAGYNVYYSGWNKGTTAPSSSVAIHHPSGDVKKISFDTDPAGSASFGGAQCWRIFNWEDGTTEPGSSGSGLWDQNGRLIGQLYGGQASCSNNVNDYYGKLSVSYATFQPWLGNCGNTLDGYPLSVGITEVMADGTGLTIAPNPSEGMVAVTFGRMTALAGVMLVHDALGRTMQEWNVPKGTDRLVFDMGDATAGVYMVELRIGAERLVQRLLIER